MSFTPPKASTNAYFAKFSHSIIVSKKDKILAEEKKIPWQLDKFQPSMNAAINSQSYKFDTPSWVAPKLLHKRVLVAIHNPESQIPTTRLEPWPPTWGWGRGDTNWKISLIVTYKYRWEFLIIWQAWWIQMNI